MFSILSIVKNNSTETGLKAIENMGNFVLFGSLAFIGVVALIICIVINIIYTYRKS